MVSDKTNRIFTELLEYLREIYPKVYGGQSYNETNVKLPYVYFFMGDMPTTLVDLSNNEVGVSPMYQIEVYTDKGLNEARKMSMDVRSFMTSNGFRCRTFTPSQLPTNVSRFIGRYERLDV